MMELFEVYFSFEVPWWNKAVDDPETKMPSTMKYLRENFEGDEYDFRRIQIMRGIRKGKEEIIKLTT